MRGGETTNRSSQARMGHGRLAGSKSLVALRIAGALLVGSMASVSQADEAPLYEQEPYDTIRLDDANKDAELKVLPLDLPDRRLPAKPNPADELEIHLVDRPRKTYKVAWESIVEVKLFEQRVLDEAERLVEAKKLDEAFRYYDFLNHRYPKMTALGPSYDKYLMAGAKEAFKHEKFEECLALATELFARNPEFPGAATAILRATDKLVERRFAAGEFSAAAALVQQTGARLKDRASSLTADWTAKLHDKATELLGQAKAKLAAKQFTSARAALRQALDAWPDISGGKELAATLQREHPEIVVAVRSLADRPLAAAATWGARRDARLIARSIVEVVAAGPSGNTYDFPLGKMTHANDDRRAEILVDRQIHWSGEKRPLTPADVAAALAAQANPTSLAFRPAWGDLLAGLSADDAGRVRIDLKQPLLHIEPWLEVPLLPDSESAGGTASLGPYHAESSDAQEARFTVVDGYFAAAPKPIGQIVERVYSDSTSAIEAIRREEVAVIDRLSPWDAASLAGSKELVVAPYSISTTDVLVPNLRRPTMSRALLRRAVAHAIDRLGILGGQLSRGKVPAGCAVVDGLLGGETSRNGAELRFDAGAARALAELSKADAATDSAPSADKGASSVGEIVLAFVPDETTRLACQAISEQTRAAGIPLRLKEIAASDLAQAPDDVDLIYVSWTPLEPLAELPRLVGREGIGGDAGPIFARLLNDALTAPRGKDAERLARLDDEIRAQTLAIPLWRVTNFYASHPSLSGVGRRPVTLFQNIEKWQLSATAEQK